MKILPKLFGIVATALFAAGVARGATNSAPVVNSLPGDSPVATVNYSTSDTSLDGEGQQVSLANTTPTPDSKPTFELTIMERSQHYWLGKNPTGNLKSIYWNTPTGRVVEAIHNNNFGVIIGKSISHNERTKLVAGTYHGSFGRQIYVAGMSYERPIVGTRFGTVTAGVLGGVEKGYTKNESSTRPLMAAMLLGFRPKNPQAPEFNVRIIPSWNSAGAINLGMTFHNVPQPKLPDSLKSAFRLRSVFKHAR